MVLNGPFVYKPQGNLIIAMTCGLWSSTEEDRHGSKVLINPFPANADYSRHG